MSVCYTIAGTKVPLSISLSFCLSIYLPIYLSATLLDFEVSLSTTQLGQWTSSANHRQGVDLFGTLPALLLFYLLFLPLLLRVSYSKFSIFAFIFKSISIPIGNLTLPSCTRTDICSGMIMYFNIKFDRSGDPVSFLYVKGN